MTKGHPFDREAFFSIFDAMPGVGWTHVEQPAAEALYSREHAAGFDAIVAYDMPGIRFRAGGPEFAEPSDLFKKRFLELLESGKGFVFLHHAIAGWPAWEQYAEILGGRFLYLPGQLRGRQCLDSGYRHAVTHEVSVVSDHPVTAGLPGRFEITDELYLYEVLEEDVEPLLRSNFDFVRENFYSAANVVLRGSLHDNSNWAHPPGSNLIGWTRRYGASRIVYLQCGDDPQAYSNPNFQQLIRNAIFWVSER